MIFSIPGWTPEPLNFELWTPLSMKTAIPIIFAWGYFVFHSANPLFQMFPFPFQSLRSVISRATIPAAGPMIRPCSGRRCRRRFHQKCGQQINADHRPKTGKNKQYDGNCSDPEDRKIKIVGQSPAHTQYNTVTRTVEPPSGYAVKSAHGSFPFFHLQP